MTHRQMVGFVESAPHGGLPKLVLQNVLVAKQDVDTIVHLFEPPGQRRSQPQRQPIAQRRAGGFQHRQQVPVERVRKPAAGLAQARQQIARQVASFDIGAVEKGRGVPFAQEQAVAFLPAWPSRVVVQVVEE